MLRACDRSGAATKREVRQALAASGEIVRADGAQRMAQYDSKSGAGFRVSVRTTGVSVRQSLRKTTGKRPDFGALQMRRALLPALASKTGAVEHELEHALDRIADTFER